MTHDRKPSARTVRAARSQARRARWIGLALVALSTVGCASRPPAAPKCTGPLSPINVSAPMPAPAAAPARLSSESGS